MTSLSHLPPEIRQAIEITPTADWADSRLMRIHFG